MRSFLQNALVPSTPILLLGNTLRAFMTLYRLPWQHARSKKKKKGPLNFSSLKLSEKLSR